MEMSLAAVSRYCSEPSSIRIVMRLVAPGTLEPAAAEAGRLMICSILPVPARSGCGAGDATTTGAVPAAGTMTVGATAVAGGAVTMAAGGAGCTTTGAGAGATRLSDAQAASNARAMAESGT